MTDEAVVNDTISQVIDKMGDIYVLINNAGVSHVSLFQKTGFRYLKSYRYKSLWHYILHQSSY